MASTIRLDILALVISIGALSAVAWLFVSSRAPASNLHSQLHDAQVVAVARSELASNRAQCFLQMSGKDTTALAKLHSTLLARNKTIIDSLPRLEMMSESELASARKLADEMLIGAAEVEQQVELTRRSMSSSQLQIADRECPSES